MTTQRAPHPTRKPAVRCTCTPTMRQEGITDDDRRKLAQVGMCVCDPAMSEIGIAVIDCPRHGLAAFCRKLLVKR